MDWKIRIIRTINLLHRFSGSLYHYDGTAEDERVVPTGDPWASSPHYKSLAMMVLNCFLFYALLVAIHLWLGKMRDWKLLLPASLIVISFVNELMLRVRH